MKLLKCPICGNVIEVTNGDAKHIMCCGKPMQEVAPNTVDAATEKHIPVYEKVDDEIIVRVGEVEHPMEKEHYINWIAQVKENKVKEIRNTAYSCPEPEKPPQDSSIQIPLNDNSFYVVPLEKIDEWKDAFPAVDIECQLKRMAAWCNANPKRRKTKKGVQRFIVNWLSDNQDKGVRFYSGNSRVIVHQDKKSDSKGELESKENLIDDEEWWRYGPNALEE